MEHGRGDHGSPPAVVPGDFDLQHLFTYHAPGPEQLPKYEALRNGGLDFAALIMAHTPPGADRSAAIRKVREAVMTANAAIALGGRL